jgi:diacylglycerol kinase family enzyme
MKRKILFVINRKSGLKRNANLPTLIDSYIDKNTIDHEIVFTKAPGHGIQLSHDAALKGYDAVIAVGGDGSVNEIAKGLLGFETALGFIPTGSGNGHGL